MILGGGDRSSLGAFVGVSLEILVGNSLFVITGVGWLEGSDVGWLVIPSVGDAERRILESGDGFSLGVALGRLVGELVGIFVEGWVVGSSVILGSRVNCVGLSLVIITVGGLVGTSLFVTLGSVGELEGIIVDLVGSMVRDDGDSDGGEYGSFDGACVS